LDGCVGASTKVDQLALAGRDNLFFLVLIVRIEVKTRVRLADVFVTVIVVLQEGVGLRLKVLAVVGSCLRGRSASEVVR